VGVSRERASNPVLGAPELAGRFLAASAARKQLGVHLADQAIGERETFFQPRQTMVERRDIV
jgi:hypothetical protein